LPRIIATTSAPLLHRAILRSARHDLNRRVLKAGHNISLVPSSSLGHSPLPSVSISRHRDRTNRRSKATIRVSGLISTVSCLLISKGGRCGAIRNFAAFLRTVSKDLNSAFSTLTVSQPTVSDKFYDAWKPGST
jgi:hypothetical protein